MSTTWSDDIDCPGTCSAREEEVEALKEQVRELTRQLTETRLELITSDAVRGALHSATVATAADMARALALTEVAFRKGVEFGKSWPTPSCTVSEAYNAWTVELMAKT